MVPLLVNMFIANQLTSLNTFVAEHADNKAYFISNIDKYRYNNFILLISVHENPITASNELQSIFLVLNSG